LFLVSYTPRSSFFLGTYLLFVPQGVGKEFFVYFVLELYKELRPNNILDTFIEYELAAVY